MYNNNYNRESKLSTSKCVYSFFPFSNYQKLHCLLVVYTFCCSLYSLPLNTSIGTDGYNDSFSLHFFAITLSIVAIDIQHEIQHIQKRYLYFEAFGIISKGSIPVRSANMKTACNGRFFLAVVARFLLV